MMRKKSMKEDPEMHPKRLIATAILGLLPATAAIAEQPAGHAMQLINQNCVRCHDNSIYGRPEGTRRVNNWDELHKQVRRCELMLGLQWFDEDVAAVAKNLNSRFYKFPIPESAPAAAQ
jgi:mono/diheme cytochrome c family protein